MIGHSIDWCPLQLETPIDPFFVVGKVCKSHLMRLTNPACPMHYNVWWLSVLVLRMLFILLVEACRPFCLLRGKIKRLEGQKSTNQIWILLVKFKDGQGCDIAEAMLMTVVRVMVEAIAPSSSTAVQWLWPLISVEIIWFKLVCL